MPTARTVSQSRYDKANTRRVVIKLNLNTDADIIDRLDEESNIMGYIKALIRADIAANSKPNE